MTRPQNMILFYDELSKDEEFLKKAAQLVVFYRFLRQGAPNELLACRLKFLCLYQDLIQPLIQRLQQTERSNPRHIEIKVKLRKTLLDKMISSCEHNGHWAVSLIQEYHEDPRWILSKRPLDIEIMILHMKHALYQRTRPSLLTEYEEHKEGTIKKLTKIKRNAGANLQNYVNEQYQKFERERKNFLDQHLPPNYRTNKTYYSKLTILKIIFLLIGLIILLAPKNFQGATKFGIACLVLVLSQIPQVSRLFRIFLELILLIFQTSTLNLENLPGNLGPGLMTEIQECIKDETDKIKRELPSEPAIAAAKEEAPQTPTLPQISLHSSSEILVPDTKEEKEKPKTRSPFPTLWTSLSPAPSPTIYRWYITEAKTKTVKEIRFQPGRVYSELFPLKSDDGTYNNTYVVYFPKAKLKGGERLLNTIWDTASVGRIVSPIGHAGYVFLTDEEKRSGNFKLSKHSLFKIKLDDKSEFAKYRAGVEDLGIDTNQANGVQLLIVNSPVETH